MTIMRDAMMYEIKYIMPPGNGWRTGPYNACMEDGGSPIFSKREYAEEAIPAMVETYLKAGAVNPQFVIQEELCSFFVPVK